MFVAVQFHEVARVVEDHYVVETIPPEIRNRIWAGRIPREVAHRRLEEMIRRDPRLIHRQPGEKSLSDLHVVRHTNLRLLPVHDERSVFIKLDALSNPTILDDDFIQWTRCRIPRPEMVTEWERIEKSWDSWGSRERRRIIREREVECARIAGDAIVALPEWWQ